MKSIQILQDNYDIKNNPKVRELYPYLYGEVKEHDLISFSSWYDLSDEAYKEFQVYLDNRDIGYMRCGR
jgi:hypothetical protein